MLHEQEAKNGTHVEVDSAYLGGSRYGCSQECLGVQKVPRVAAWLEVVEAEVETTGYR